MNLSVEKPKMVQVHFTLDLAGMRTPRNLNKWKKPTRCLHDNKWVIVSWSTEYCVKTHKKKVGPTQNQGPRQSMKLP